MAKKLTQAQVKARLADPRMRTTIPTAQLPAKYQAMRARAKAGKAATAALDDPAALTAPLTPRTLAEQVQASTDLQFGEQDRTLQGQRAVNAQMATNIPAWFQGYQNSLAQAASAQERANAAAVAAQQQAADSSSALDSQQRASLQSGLQADAATRGATVDPNIAATGQQAAAARRSSMDAFTGLQAGIGAATSGLAANRQVVAAGQQVSALQGERNVGLNLDRAAQALATDKGNYATTFRQKLVDAEHTKQLENKAFGLDVEKAQADVQSKAATLQDRARARATTNRNADQSRSETARHNRAMEAQARARLAAKGAGGKPRTAGQKAKDTATRDQIKYTISQITQLRSHKQPVMVPEEKNGKKTGRFVPKLDAKTGKPALAPANLTPLQIRRALENGEGPLTKVERDIYNAALDVQDRGFISAANVKALHARGISIAALGFPTEAQSRKKAKARPRADTGDILAGSKAG